MTQTPIKPKVTPIDILLPVHGRLDLTIKCVRSLYDFTQVPFHLIVLDDTEASIKLGSYHQVDPADITAPYFNELVKKRSNVTYINRATPYKCGNEFFNEGFRAAKTEYCATVMNSMTVEPGWETVGLQLMDADPQIGVIGFKCLFPNGQIESAGIVFNNFTPCDYGRDEPGHRHPEVAELAAVQWAFALVRKKAAVGNLQENIMYGFVGWDDIDNCFALRAKGWKVVYCGMGVGVHQPRATRGTDQVDGFLKNRHNAHAFYKRWGLWKRWQEAQKMDVGYKLKPQTKDVLAMAVTEYQVVTKLLEERKDIMGKLCRQAMGELGVDPGKYILDINPGSGIWDLRAVPDENVQKVEPIKDMSLIPESRPYGANIIKEEVPVG